MAFCVKCGNQLAENVKFCIKCGTAVSGADPQQATVKPAIEKVGNIRKCPACGAEVPAMTANCSNCGHEFNDNKVSTALLSFFEKLEEIEDLEEKLRYISVFPVPNTKEDILEFAIMASSNIQHVNVLTTLGVGYLRVLSFGIWKGPAVSRYNKAWRTKIKQIYTKGRIALTGDKSALEQIEAIVANVEKSEKKSKRNLMISLICIVAFYIILFTVGGRTSPEDEKRWETQRLNRMYTEIVQSIKDGDLVDAKLKTNQLTWERKDPNGEQKKIWDEKRMIILKEIETLQNQEK
jgi:predicted nucleic acid-binding Zn ribbon protein